VSRILVLGALAAGLLAMGCAGGATPRARAVLLPGLHPLGTLSNAPFACGPNARDSFGNWIRGCEPTQRIPSPDNDCIEGLRVTRGDRTHRCQGGQWVQQDDQGRWRTSLQAGESTGAGDAQPRALHPTGAGRGSSESAVEPLRARPRK